MIPFTTAERKVLGVAAPSTTAPLKHGEPEPLKSLRRRSDRRYRL